MTLAVKEGTIWAGSDRNEFQVIHVVETEGNVWVHYREHPKKYKHVTECKEYSCYQESFLARFSPLPE